MGFGVFSFKRKEGTYLIYVVVLGASTGQQALKAGLVDELQIAIAPILLGTGLRFFEHLDDLEIELEKIKTIETGRQVDIWYMVI